MKGIRKIILPLAAIVIGLAIGSQATVGVPQEEDVPVDPPTVQEDSVESVQTPPPEEVPEPPEEVPEPTYTAEELNILAIIIYQEAGSDLCSDDTRRMVGSVFLNRVNHSSFPDTFEKVATGKRQYGTLYWTGIVWPDRAVNPGEAHAVERAYRIAEELLLGGSILPSNVIWQAEFPQGDGIYCQQDGIYFCYSEVSK